MKARRDGTYLKTLCMRNFTESLPPNIEGPLFQGTEEVVWERIVKLFEFFLLLQIYLLHMNGWE